MIGQTYFIPFEHGVHSILHIKWTMEAVTPLVIRDGTKAAFSEDIDEYAKSRGRKPELVWAGSDQNYSEIADLNFVFQIENNELKCQYQIPASSVRGALRSHAISRWVAFDDRDAFSLPKKQENSETQPDGKIEELPTMEQIRNRLSKAKIQLEGKRNGWYGILSLFGIAFNPMNDPVDPMTWAGRLTVSTNLKARKGEVTISDKKVQQSGGPQYTNRSVAYRNPIDRTIQAAKSTGSGLHNWLEYDPGTIFDTNLSIRNPRRTDTALINFWEHEIEKGMLRLGSLRSVGRGQLRIVSSKFKLFASPKTPLANRLQKAARQCKTVEGIDPLTDLWVGGALTLQELTQLLRKTNSKKEEGNTHG